MFGQGRHYGKKKREKKTTFVTASARGNTWCTSLANCSLLWRVLVPFHEETLSSLDWTAVSAACTLLSSWFVSLHKLLVVLTTRHRPQILLKECWLYLFLNALGSDHYEGVCRARETIKKNDIFYISGGLTDSRRQVIHWHWMTWKGNTPPTAASYTHIRFSCCCCCCCCFVLFCIFAVSLFAARRVWFSNWKQPLCDIGREERGFLQQSLSCPLSLQLCPTFSTRKVKWHHSPFF